MRVGRRIGVDVGAARVGVATCDAHAVLAVPVDTYPREAIAESKAGPAARAALDRLVDLVRETEPIEVVIGLPLHLSGAEGASADAARSFARALAQSISPVSVRLVDERLTTVDAHRALQASGRATRTHRAVVDQVAAVMILQGALDAERDSGTPPGTVVGAKKPRHRRRA